jgi:hypothetical protein
MSLRVGKSGMEPRMYDFTVEILLLRYAAISAAVILSRSMKCLKALCRMRGKCIKTISFVKLKYDFRPFRRSDQTCSIAPCPR